MSDLKQPCLYCGGDKCRCMYRAGRKGIESTETWTTHASTVAKMRKAFDELIGSRSPDQPCLWKLSFTRLKIKDEAND